jgi:hypothetical protein
MILQRWHTWIGQPKFDKAWHMQDIADELGEYREESKLLKKWSELSDVVYTCTRARWSGYRLAFPLAWWQYPLGLAYMYPKYTLRFLFYRRAGRKAGASTDIRCVRNPHKLHKLDEIVDYLQIKVDKPKLHQICQHQLKHWLLLP